MRLILMLLKLTVILYCIVCANAEAGAENKTENERVEFFGLAQIPNAPISMTNFITPTKQTASPVSGRILLTPIASKSKLRWAEENSFSAFELANAAKNIEQEKQQLPTIEFDFVQKQQQIIPLDRTLQTGRHSYWDYFVGIGSIGKLTDKYQQVSLPFSLVEKNQNCVHNGVLSFVLNEQLQASSFYYQISNETCIYFKVDMWGFGQSDFMPAESQPVQQQAQLNHNFPAHIDQTKLALAEQISATDMSLFAYQNNSHSYYSNCATRAGNYPFCSQLVMPSYSLAKSIFATISLFYLANDYPDIFNQQVAHWVPECNNESWEKVTFEDLSNMASGHYQSSKHHVDEGAEHGLIFFNAKTHKEKISYACNQYKPQVEPGTRFVYHTSDTYLLGTALTNYLKHKQSGNADLFNDIFIQQLWPEMNLSPVAYTTRRTQDATAQPFAGYGLFLLPEDLIKITGFMARQLIYPEANSQFTQAKRLQVLQQNPHDMNPTTPFKTLNYRFGLWSQQIGQFLNCQHPKWLPFMSGYGGIAVVFISREEQYFYVSDSNHHDWRNAMKTIHQFSSLCQ